MSFCMEWTKIADRISLSLHEIYQSCVSLPSLVITAVNTIKPNKDSREAVNIIKPNKE